MPSTLNFVSEFPAVGGVLQEPSSRAIADYTQAAAAKPTEVRSRDLFSAQPRGLYATETIHIVSLLSAPSKQAAGGSCASPEISNADSTGSLLCDASSNSDTSLQPLLKSLQSAVTPRGPGILNVAPTQAPSVEKRHAELLHYFKSAIGSSWFDVTDPGFTREALLLAPRCPLLLFAMLATAAIHRSRFIKDPTIAHDHAVEAQDYHEQCVTLLLSMLYDRRAVTDGAFLACSAILRFYEEMSVPFHGRDDARHLLGGYAAVAELQIQNLQCAGLSGSAFWVHQRQDTYNALINQRAPNTDLGYFGVDMSVSPANEYLWAKRPSCLMADCVEFCFGGPHPANRYKEVMRRLEEWFVHKPDTFSPVYYQDCDTTCGGSIFPEIRLLMDYAAFALSYYYFCLLLMMLFDPTVPRIGPQCLKVRRRTEVKNYCDLKEAASLIIT